MSNRRCLGQNWKRLNPNQQLIEEKGRWKVYDVVIEGVSLVNNYRTQFREILANQTPKALLDILRKKLVKGVQVRIGTGKHL
jgi:phospholipid transport system substrate-binding protein